MKKSDKWKIGYTIEFYPEEGKYHYSGHRSCKVSLSPEQIRSEGMICSICHKKVTEGVFIRLSQLAGSAGLQQAVVSNRDGVHWMGDSDKNQPPFVKLVPLLEVIAQALGSSVASKKAKDKYDFVLSALGPELDILLDVPLATIALGVGERIAEGVAKVRQGDLLIEPGYDGEYGVVRLWREGAGRAALNAPQLKLEI
jgi:PHP family Zn ribbon phosphoesterase